ncbi:MAG: hypothetical protein KME64_21005 [Scytonematopsis contorta HA4267-MV1]|jgi:hypothetical protein|nr:hypothetical protein [Scytonematopsis contorta HA4267-MV1]
MDAIDKLLAEIQSEHEKSNELKPQQTQPLATNKIVSPSVKAASLIDNLLAEVQADFTELDKAIELKKQQQIEEERIQQEQIKAEKLAELKNLAKDWLEKLDPFSPEGLWFENFAQKYSDKLEAAIEYLQM